MWEKFGKLAFISFARIAVLRDIGPCLNPFEASMLLAGLETLSVRMDKVCKNASELASWLCRNANINEVAYPGIFS
jgi:O-acetylhomoserine/O-acetylserine sulfhydrylase